MDFPGFRNMVRAGVVGEGQGDHMKTYILKCNTKMQVISIIYNLVLFQKKRQMYLYKNIKKNRH